MAIKDSAGDAGNHYEMPRQTSDIRISDYPRDPLRETIPIDKSRVFYEQINDEPIDKGLSLLERFDFGREEYQAPRRLTPPILRETILRSYSPEVVDDEYGGSVYVLMAREMVSSPYARQKLEEFDQVASGQL